jgi:hypothetical protein
VLLDSGLLRHDDVFALVDPGHVHGTAPHPAADGATGDPVDGSQDDPGLDRSPSRSVALSLPDLQSSWPHAPTS